MITSYFDLCSIMHVNCHFSCCLQTSASLQPRKWSIALCDFLKMLGIVAVAGEDVLKYLTIAVANAYGCHTFGIGHNKCEITVHPLYISINFLIKITSVEPFNMTSVVGLEHHADLRAQNNSGNT